MGRDILMENHRRLEHCFPAINSLKLDHLLLQSLEPNLLDREKLGPKNTTKLVNKDISLAGSTQKR
jgi:hypothetical protein